MRIMILGGSGMLGHQLAANLLESHEVHVLVRTPDASQLPRRFKQETKSAKVHFGVDARDWPNLELVVRKVKPDAVLNAVGIIKQSKAHSDAILNIEINALLPHRLKELCISVNSRLVHFSTDCVFSGDKGAYEESDPADATDLYGRTKLLGEVAGEGIFTLRTSFIGLELKRATSLIEWFLSQRESLRGFRGGVENLDSGISGNSA